MRLVDRELERIVKRLRRLAHVAREILRPRLELRRIERVGRRPNLQDDRVEIQLDRLVENRDQLMLLPSAGSPGRDGQSMFWTVATHAARNSRATGGGSSAAIA